MEIENPVTGNTYTLNRGENFEVSSSRLHGKYFSRDLRSAIMYILKTERAYLIFNLPPESVQVIKVKLARYNLENLFPADLNIFKTAVLRERLNLSYYDSLLLAINKAFLRGDDRFVFTNENKFEVYDEVVNIIKDHMETKHLMSF
jgi:hypothetical protein